jgi:hypothetical protein
VGFRVFRGSLDGAVCCEGAKGAKRREEEAIFGGRRLSFRAEKESGWRYFAEVSKLPNLTICYEAIAYLFFTDLIVFIKNISMVMSQRVMAPKVT